MSVPLLRRASLGALSLVVLIVASFIGANRQARAADPAPVPAPTLALPSDPAPVPPTAPVPPANPSTLTAGATNEPPLVLFLEAGGRTFPVALDEPLPAEALQAGAPPVLRLAPHREFRFLGLSFRYPREFTFEFERGEDGYFAWTLSGRDTTVILNWFPGEPDHRTMRKEVVKEFQEAVAEENKEARPKRSRATLEHARGRLEGDRVAFNSFGVEMDQATFSFRGGDGSFVLIVQDSDDGEGLPSAERRRIERWLRESLTLPPVVEPTRKPTRPDRLPESGSRAERSRSSTRPRG